MNIKVKLLVFLTFLIVAGISGLAVLHTEQEKRTKKYLAEKDYYQSQYNDWLVYKKDYDEQIKKLAEENRATMAATKSQYETLLAQQPELIKEHTRLQADGTINNNTTIGTINSNDQTITQTVRVSRPVSKPKTRAS